MKPEKRIKGCDWNLGHVAIVVTSCPAVNIVMNVLQVDIILYVFVQLRCCGERGIGDRDGQQAVDHFRCLPVRGTFSQPLRCLQGILDLCIVDNTVFPGFTTLLNVLVIWPATGTDAVTELCKSIPFRKFCLLISGNLHRASLPSLLEPRGPRNFQLLQNPSAFQLAS